MVDPVIEQVDCCAHCPFVTTADYIPIGGGKRLYEWACLHRKAARRNKANNGPAPLYERAENCPLADYPVTFVASEST